MTKSELRSIIREVLTEEINASKLQEAIQEGTGTYVIKVWDRPDQRGSVQTKFDSTKEGKTYVDFDAVLAELKSEGLEGCGAYDIYWVPSVEK